MQYEIADSFAMPVSLLSANLMTNLQIVMLICVFESQTLVASSKRARRPFLGLLHPYPIMQSSDCNWAGDQVTELQISWIRLR